MSDGAGVPDPDRVRRFARVITASGRVRIPAEALWRALAEAFPHREPGPAERSLLVAVLAALAAEGVVRLPAPGGRRWDRSLAPPVPRSVDVVRPASPAPSPAAWRSFPWHPALRWVADLRSPTPAQLTFLRRVQEGLVDGHFAEPAPLKYRSLQITGHEKRLQALAATGLFGPGRLSLELLGCLPEVLPLAWEPVGAAPRGRLLIFENAGPFVVARKVLASMPDPPYDLVAFGGGRSFVAALGHLLGAGVPLVSLDYLGDLDAPGLEIALAAQARAFALGLPPFRPAARLHQALFDAARDLGHPSGWPARRPRRTDARLLEFLPAGLRDAAARVLAAGRRIPEEVLGPDELRAAFARSAVPAASGTGST